MNRRNKTIEFQAGMNRPNNDQNVRKELIASATRFIEQVQRELGRDGTEARITQVKRDILETGTYRHTPDELQYGAKLAWRNSNRCIGRLFHQTLEVFDCRDLIDEEEIEHALRRHLSYATNGGRIRSAITIFRQQIPEEEPIRIWNPKLVRYAGYEKNGTVTGDPEEKEFTAVCESLGWEGDGTPFDLLPVVLTVGERSPYLFEWSSEEALQVELDHPEFEWFRELGLRWYAVPVIADMVLEIGGIHYPAAPFNGWFMETEIGSRNLGDAERYNMLHEIAAHLGLDKRSPVSMWKDRALLELNRAVLHSFRRDGVRIVDHHTASKQFLVFNEKERQQGREVMADWAWIVPPMSGSATGVFHNKWENRVVSPNFYYSNPAWKGDGNTSKKGCPFHADSLHGRF